VNKPYSKIFAFILISLIICACSEKQSKVPAHIIQPDKMSDILYDIHIVETSLLHLQQTNHKVSDKHKELYDLTFKKHEVSKQEFDSSLTYYATKNLKALETVYAKIITDLSQKQAELKNQ